MVVGEVFSETFRFSKIEILILLGKYLEKRERRCGVILYLLI
jgi:hypothetical protein